MLKDLLLEKSRFLKSDYYNKKLLIWANIFCLFKLNFKLDQFEK